jgi:hypothetical protein
MFQYRLKAQAQARGRKFRLRPRLMVFKIGPGSGSKYFEPRLARPRLRLVVFGPIIIISNKYVISTLRSHTHYQSPDIVGNPTFSV